MSTINFDQVFQTLKEGVLSIAKGTLQDYYNEAKSDGESVLDNMKDNLQHWSSEMENGSLTFDDLGFLLKEEMAYDEMVALKQAGLAEVRIDEFRNAVINMVLGTITGLIKI